jgi:hypothetical protein
MEQLITQREAAERIATEWGMPMHESRLSVLVSVGVGPTPHGKRGASTMYTVEAIDAWAAAEVRRRLCDLETQAAELHATIARMGY